MENIIFQKSQIKIYIPKHNTFQKGPQTNARFIPGVRFSSPLKSFSSLINTSKICPLYLMALSFIIPIIGHPQRAEKMTPFLSKMGGGQICAFNDIFNGASINSTTSYEVDNHCSLFYKMTNILSFNKVIDPTKLWWLLRSINN